MMTTKKWYNLDLPYNTKEAIRRVEVYREWLINNGYQFEASACGDMVHLEVLMPIEDVPKANEALDRLVWFDAVYIR